MSDCLLFAGNASKNLAKRIVESNASIRLGQIKHIRFPSGELYCQYQENIRGRDVFLLNSISDPANDNLMQLLVMADAARRASAGKITAVIPYMGYSRQDRKNDSREPISAKLVMDLLSASGFDRVVTMDLHAPQIAGFTNLPFDHLLFRPSLINNVAEYEVEVIVSPDVGAVKKCEEYSSKMGIDLAIISKKRMGVSKVEAMHFIGDVKDKMVLIVDDLTESAGTLVEAAIQCKKNGASCVMCAITHGCFTRIGNERLIEAFENNLIDKLFVSNTIEPSPSTFIPWGKLEGGTILDFSDKVSVIDVAPVFASAIDSIHNDKSVSHLFT